MPGFLCKITPKGRRGSDPSGAKAEARKAPTVEALCKKFMEDYSK